MKGKGQKKNGNDHQLTRRSMVTKQILHVSVLRKLENSMENLHDDVGVYRVTKHNLSFAAVSSRNALSHALREKTACQSNCCMKCFNIAT